MKKALLALLLASAFPAFSNDWKNISTSVTLGYESSYVLYGYNQGPHLFHADVLLSAPVSEKVSVWAGSWYGTQFDGTYKEADVYAGLDYQLSEHFSAGLAYSLFDYIETPYPTSKQAHEFSGHFTYAAGPFSLSLKDLYDSEGEGHLARVVAGFDQPLTKNVSLSLSAEYGYSFDYFAAGNGPNHVLFRAALPWQLNRMFSVEPFIAHSVVLDVLDSFEQDRTYGGVSLTASF